MANNITGKAYLAGNRSSHTEDNIIIVFQESSKTFSDIIYCKFIVTNCIHGLFHGSNPNLLNSSVLSFAVTKLKQDNLHTHERAGKSHNNAGSDLFETPSFWPGHSLLYSTKIISVSLAQHQAFAPRSSLNSVRKSMLKAIHKYTLRVYQPECNGSSTGSFTCTADSVSKCKGLSWIHVRYYQQQHLQIES